MWINNDYNNIYPDQSVGLGGGRFQGKIKNIAKDIHGDAFYGGNLVVYVNVVFDLSTSLNGQRGRRQEQVV